MPTYEYRCRQCGKAFAQHESMAQHEAKTPPCPKCGSSNVTRTVSAAYVKTSKKS